jgi:hypothetical protein
MKKQGKEGASMTEQRTATAKPDPVVRGLGVFAVAFGLLTIASGGTTLFGGPAAREAAGAYVPFVLWFNFLAGFAYVAAGVGLWRQRRWAAPVAAGVALATLLVFAAFEIHVLRGGAYEARTVGAMTLRSVVWVAIAWVCARRMRRLR